MDTASSSSWMEDESDKFCSPQPLADGEEVLLAPQERGVVLRTWISIGRLLAQGEFLLASVAMIG